MMIWTAINSAALLVLGGAVVLMIRQVGLMLREMGPVGARGSTEGPRIGEDVGNALGGRLFTSGRPGLYIFGSTSCPICSVVQEGARHLAPVWSSRASVIMIYDGPASAEETRGDRNRGELRLAYDPTLRRRLAIRSVPFGVMVNAAGIVVAQGLVNNESHTESLLETLDRSPAVMTEEEPAADTSDAERPLDNARVEA